MDKLKKFFEGLLRINYGSYKDEEIEELLNQTKLIYASKNIYENTYLSSLQPNDFPNILEFKTIILESVKLDP